MDIKQKKTSSKRKKKKTYLVDTPPKDAKTVPGNARHCQDKGRVRTGRIVQFPQSRVQVTPHILSEDIIMLLQDPGKTGTLPLNPSVSLSQYLELQVGEVGLQLCSSPETIVQYNTIQYNTIQYNTIQYNTQYNTIQYNTMH